MVNSRNRDRMTVERKLDSGFLVVIEHFPPPNDMSNQMKLLNAANDLSSLIAALPQKGRQLLTILHTCHSYR